MLRHTLEAYRSAPEINQLRVVIADGDERHYGPLWPASTCPPRPGGASRQQSVLNGLEALAGEAPDFVAIHDAARPFVRPVDIAACLDAAATRDRRRGPGRAAVRHREADGGDGAVVDTIPRANLWRAQTPQGFRYASLLTAHRAAAALGHPRRRR